MAVPYLWYRYLGTLLGSVKNTQSKSLEIVAATVRGSFICGLGSDLKGEEGKEGETEERDGGGPPPRVPPKEEEEEDDESEREERNCFSRVTLQRRSKESYLREKKRRNRVASSTNASQGIMVQSRANFPGVITWEIAHFKNQH